MRDEEGDIMEEFSTVRWRVGETTKYVGTNIQLGSIVLRGGAKTS